MTLFIGSVQLGLMYGLLALGAYIPFRILNTPDLTGDGSFTLGMAVSAALAAVGHPYLGIFMAIIAGGLAGTITGTLQTKVGINPILSGILTMSGLYSVNLFIMGARANVSLIGMDTVFSDARALLPGLDKDLTKALVALAFALAMFFLFNWFFKTQLGLCIRATGDNEAMVRSSSVNVDSMRILALAMGNSMVALSGAVVAQYQGFADIGSGIGMLVVGLASVIIGEMIFGKRTILRGLLAAFIGSILYRIIIAIALKTDLLPNYMLKLVSAAIVALALSIPGIRTRVAHMRIRREARRNA